MSPASIEENPLAKETRYEILTENIRRQLIANGRKQDLVRGTEDEIDFSPVVKLFTPDAGCTWLLTEIDPEDEDIAFGLCDLGMGSPELRPVRISEIEALRGKLGLPVERDLYFEADKALSAYADDARVHGRVRA